MKVFELTSRRIAPLVLLCCFVCLGSPSLRAQDFKYQNFTATEGNIPELKLNGNAAPAISNSLNVLRITPAVTDPFQVGSAWFCGSACPPGTGTLLPLSNGFSTTFKFQLSGSTTTLGNTAPGPSDGFAFVIQNGCFSFDDTSLCNINALDPIAGGTHGYDGLTNSLAVEFVTYCQPLDSDICDSITTASNGTSSANQIAIQSCGAAANTANIDSCNFGKLDLGVLFFLDGAEASTTAGSKTVTLTGGEGGYTAAQMQNMVGLSFVINGLDFGLITATNATNQTLTLATAAPSTQAATVNYAIEPVLGDGNVHTATITYTPPTSCGDGCINPNMTVTLDNNVVLVSSSGIDIVDNVLGGNDGALVGFTGSSGGGDDNQDILTWTYDTAQTNTVSCGLAPLCGPFTESYSYDGGADTWTVNFAAGVPNGALLTAWRTEFTEADWAQRTPPGNPYSGTTLAPVSCTGFSNCNIATGDGVVWSALLTVNGVEFNPITPVLYTLTAEWNSSDNNYPTENPALLKAHPSGADNWADILLLSFNQPNIDPLPTNKGGSKTPCSDYGNVSGVKGTKPAVTITSPADGSTYTPNQIVDANFSCSGNSVTGCVGILDPLISNTPVNLGAAVDTLAVDGTSHTFSVIADVSSGPSGTASATYFVSNGTYGVQLLYASNRAVKSGADFPIKMYLTNSSGMDVSSSSLVVHALKVILVSTNTSDTVAETGGSNPDLDFRFDGTQGPTGGYIFNLKTTGLGSGQYVLQFEVLGGTDTGSPLPTYVVPFAVK